MSQNVLASQINSSQSDKLFAFTQGIHLDRRLAEQEVRVQQAWVEALAEIDILTEAEADRLTARLEEARQLMHDGVFPWRMQDEDIHMNLERFVTEKHGELGKRMHLGRSRNDLIATSLRLYVAETVKQVQKQLAKLIQVLSERGEKDIDVIIAGMTHLQHGQPLRYSHVLASHGWSMVRDLGRLGSAAQEALSYMPLGAAALSGTTLPLDLPLLAQRLGFAHPNVNSYDAVGDRDFMLQALDAFSTTAMHLSRLAEDVIYWSSTSVGLLKLPKAWSTGSSIMPNKRNPDVMELTRARATKVMGASGSARLLLKSLPSSYQSDLHELKAVYMQSFEELLNCLGILPEFMAELKPNRERAVQMLKSGHILATDIVDQLVMRGLTFREAYKQVAGLVEQAEASGVQVHELPADQILAIAPKLDAEFLKALTPERVVERRCLQGGTAKVSVRQGLEALESTVAPYLYTGNGHAQPAAQSISGRLWEMAEWL